VRAFGRYGRHLRVREVRSPLASDTAVCGAVHSPRCAPPAPPLDRLGFRLAVSVSLSLLLLTATDAQAADRAPNGARQPEVAEDGQWTMAPKNYANTRYSGLQEITTENVKSLKVAWTFSTGVNRGQEAAPIVVGQTMYIVTPYPNFVYALDLAKNGAMKWSFSPDPDAASQGVACCDYVNRGAVYTSGKIIFNTLDAHTIALDAETGKQLWKTKLGDVNIGETITMAPLVVGSHVLVGNAGGELGVRGWLTALEVNTGKISWRAYSTGPDADVLIGPEFKPFYPQDRGKDLGVSSWPSDHWKVGGGTVWGWISYDPELNLIFYGTANPGPWNPEQRPGDNRWTAGIFARNPDTGQARWFYQWSPHDLFDYDGVNENVLLELPINGQDRKVIVHPERNGYVYVLDRTTGEVLSATPFVRITSSHGIDLKTGRPIHNEGKTPQNGKVIRDVSPASPGAKDWQPSAFSPRTGLLYLPLCLFSPHRPALPAAPESLDGLRRHRGELHRRHALRRSQCENVRRRRRAPRRLHRLGSGRQKESVG
jgi:lanthanide-dependent methanol dehydrogenase